MALVVASILVVATGVALLELPFARLGGLSSGRLESSEWQRLSPPTSEGAAPRPASWTAVTWSLATRLTAAGEAGSASRLLAWDGGFVAVGETSREETALWVSEDGRDWEHVAVPGGGFTGATIDILFEGGPGVVAVAQEGPMEDQYAPRMVLSSSDGRRWTATRQTGLETWVHDVTRLPDRYLAFGHHRSGDPVVWQSEDAIEWSVDGTLSALFEGLWGPRIVAVPSGFVASASGVTSGRRGERAPHHSWWSPDGRSWQPFEVEPGEGVADVQVASAGVLATTATKCPGCLFAGGDHWRSTDGLRWTKVDPPGRRVTPGEQIVVANGSFVALPMDVAEGLFVSQNGVDWDRVQSRQTSPVDLGYWSVVAAGSRGVVMAGTRVSEETTHGRSDTVWFGEPFTGAADRAPGEEMVYVPPGAFDHHCLPAGKECGLPGTVAVPPDLAERLPDDAGPVPCPPGVSVPPRPTDPPEPSVAPGEPSPVRNVEALDGWRQIGPDLYLLDSGECVGVPDEAP